MESPGTSSGVRGSGLVRCASVAEDTIAKQACGAVEGSPFNGSPLTSPNGGSDANGDNVNDDGEEEVDIMDSFMTDWDISTSAEGRRMDSESPQRFSER